MKKLLLTIGLTYIATLAHSMDENLANCRHTTGIKMEADECAVFQRVDRENEARIARDQKQRSDIKAMEAQWQKERDEKALSEKQAYAARMQRERAEQDQRQADYAAEQAAQDRIDAAEDRKAKARTAARRASCGNDYLNPQIGMAIERAQQCVGTFKVAAQLNRADGVVTTYRGNQIYLHVMSGRVVSWGKY